MSEPEISAGAPLHGAPEREGTRPPSGAGRRSGCRKWGCGALLLVLLLLGLSVWRIAGQIRDLRENLYQEKPRAVGMPDVESTLPRTTLGVMAVAFKLGERPLREGQTLTLSLPEEAVNLFLSWLHSDLGAGPGEGIAVDFEGETLHLKFCARVPSRGYINLESSFRLRIEDGKLSLQLDRFRIGDAEAGWFVRSLAAGMAEQWYAMSLEELRQEKALRAVSDPVWEDFAWARRALRKVEVRGGLLHLAVDGSEIDWERFE